MLIRLMTTTTTTPRGEGIGSGWCEAEIANSVDEQEAISGAKSSLNSTNRFCSLRFVRSARYKPCSRSGRVVGQVGLYPLYYVRSILPCVCFVKNAYLLKRCHITPAGELFTKDRKTKDCQARLVSGGGGTATDLIFHQDFHSESNVD